MRQNTWSASSRLHLEQERLPEPCADGDREAAEGVRFHLAGADYPSPVWGHLVRVDTEAVAVSIQRRLFVAGSPVNAGGVSVFGAPLAMRPTRAPLDIFRSSAVRAIPKFG